MSLITFKDGMMVGDKRSFLGDLHRDGVVKILRTEDEMLIGVTGRECKTKEIIEWLLADYDGTPYPDGSGESAVLVYDGIKLSRYCGSRIPCELPVDEPFADGPDMPAGIALGAMYSGATAEEANLLAQKYCSFCGGGVDILYREPVQK